MWLAESVSSHAFRAMARVPTRRRSGSSGPPASKPTRRHHVGCCLVHFAGGSGGGRMAPYQSAGFISLLSGCEARPDLTRSQVAASRITILPG